MEVGAPRRAGGGVAINGGRWTSGRWACQLTRRCGTRVGGARGLGREEHAVGRKRKQGRRRADRGVRGVRGVRQEIDAHTHDDHRMARARQPRGVRHHDVQEEGKKW